MGEFSKFMYNQCNYITMAKKDNNIVKSYKLKITERDKEFKRRYQAASPEERKTFGYDFPNDADAHDLEIVSAMEEWLRDGNPVD